MKTQVVSDRIFPPNRRIMVALIFEKWNIGDYPVVNFSQGHLSGWGAFKCHRYQISIATVTPGIFSENMALDLWMDERDLDGRTIITREPYVHPILM